MLYRFRWHWYLSIAIRKSLAASRTSIWIAKFIQTKPEGSPYCYQDNQWPIIKNKKQNNDKMCADCSPSAFKNVDASASVGAIWRAADCTKEATWHRQDRVSGSLLNSCHSLLEKVGSFIKPLNPAESFKSSRHQPLPPRRGPEIRAERYSPELIFLEAFRVIELFVVFFKC